MTTKLNTRLTLAPDIETFAREAAARAETTLSAYITALLVAERERRKADKLAATQKAFWDKVRAIAEGKAEARLEARDDRARSSHPLMISGAEKGTTQ